MKTSKVTFDAPAGAVPEGTAVGEEFDLVSTYRLEKGGKCCLIVMGETKMPGYSEDKSSHDNYASEANAMREGMMGGGGMGGAEMG